LSLTLMSALPPMCLHGSCTIPFSLETVYNWCYTRHDYWPCLHFASLLPQLRLPNQVDDPMAIFHTHASAGGLEGILTGFFPMPKLCRLFNQLGIQLCDIVFVICLNVITTIPTRAMVGLVVLLRLCDEVYQVGDDDAIHGEEAFALWNDGERFENIKHNRVYETEEFLSYVKSRRKGDDIEI
ncbi:hypothetical protein Tsubulata_007082, partial [Turnera subulata]